MTAFGGHVLIIEDEPVIALELETLLGDLGFASFDIADCPQDALACARAHRPTLITADYRIVAGTGVEAVAMITEAVGEIPVVYVTGNPDMLPMDLGLQVIDKPISLRALTAACNHLNARHRLSE